MSVSHETVEPGENLSELKYRTKNWCDLCDNFGGGTMIKMGPEPAVFVCFKCDDAPARGCGSDD